MSVLCFLFMLSKRDDDYHTMLASSLLIISTSQQKSLDDVHVMISSLSSSRYHLNRDQPIHQELLFHSVPENAISSESES